MAWDVWAHRLNFSGRVLEANGEMPEKLKSVMRVRLEVLVVTSMVQEIPFLVRLADILMLF